MINSEFDDRYFNGNSIISHDGNACRCVKAKTLFDIDQQISLIDDIDVVIIDEGQFFPDLKKYVLKFCEEYNKIIVVAGLISDFGEQIW